MTEDEKTIRGIVVFWVLLLIAIALMLIRLKQQNEQHNVYKNSHKPPKTVTTTYLYDTCDACCIYRYFGWKNNHIGVK